MDKNSSTMDLNFKYKDRVLTRKIKTSLFKPKIINNLKPKNIKFFTFHSGFKKKNKDLLIVVFERPVFVATLYSKTSTPSAPIIWDKKNNNGLCKVLIVNAGNANAHTGDSGIKVIDKYSRILCQEIKCPLNQVLVSSTGVIGEKLDAKKIINKIYKISSTNNSFLLDAAKSIMTTDTFPKTIVRKIKYSSKIYKLYGFAKGSGMIAPNMGTMLAYIFIEVNLTKAQLKKLLHGHVQSTFNSISVDGDTSTSDTIMLFSSGDNKFTIKDDGLLFKKISSVLKDLMLNLAKQIVCDGEGITKLIEIDVIKARSFKQATLVAFSVANSLLVKTAIAGQDANWGRVIMAIGKSEARINQSKIKLKFGKFIVAKNGQMASNINTKKLNIYMKNKVIKINIDLGLGKFNRKVYSSDLTQEYVRINSDYRS